MIYRTKVGKQHVTVDIGPGFSIRPPTPRCECCEHDEYHVLLQKSGLKSLRCTGCGATYDMKGQS